MSSIFDTVADTATKRNVKSLNVFCAKQNKQYSFMLKYKLYYYIKYFKMFTIFGIIFMRLIIVSNVAPRTPSFIKCTLIKKNATFNTEFN